MKHHWFHEGIINYNILIKYNKILIHITLDVVKCRNYSPQSGVYIFDMYVNYSCEIRKIIRAKIQIFALRYHTFQVSSQTI